MKTKFKLLSIITAFLCAVAVIGCSNIIEDLKEKEKPSPSPVSYDPYLTFKGDGAFNLRINVEELGVKGWDGTVEYSTDKTTWTVWDGSTEIPAVESNGKYYLYLRGKNTTFYDNESGFSTKLGFDDASTSPVECDGNIMTLLDWENPGSATLKKDCFSYLYYRCKRLTKAPALPATILADNCYESMFYYCDDLITAPELPATTLANECYFDMFYGCSALVEAPALPAKTLADNCYTSMFTGCSSLTTIGKFGDGDVINISSDDSMSYMFENCSKLKVIETTDTDPDRFITIGSITGATPTDDMFDGCATGSVTTPEAGKSYKVAPPFVASNYLTFEGNDTFTLGINDTLGGSKAWDGTVYYSTDKTKWKEWNKTDDSTISSSAVSDGKAYIYLAGQGNTGFTTIVGTSPTGWTVLSLTGPATDIKCTGNIMTLLDSKNPNGVTMNHMAFFYLLAENEQLTEAPELPAETLSITCYGFMFVGCSSLKNAPELPATTLTSSCYEGMFAGCSSLKTAPELNATVLDDECYKVMFSGCTSLEAAPELKVETLVDGCYNGMFSGCTSLTATPVLPATSLVKECYYDMFKGCTGLKTIGKIGKGNTLDVSTAYTMQNMFKSCSGLKFVETTASDTDGFITFGTITGEDAVDEMFYGCATGSVITPTGGKSYKYIVPTPITGSVTISGFNVVGETLTAAYTPGTAGETVTYQWYRVDESTTPATETKISGATSSTYKLVSDDIGKKIKVVVTGSGDYSKSLSAISNEIVEPTYNVKWSMDIYDKAKASKTIIFGASATYASAVSSLEKTNCGFDAPYDQVYSYFDSTEGSETLYILADGKIRLDNVSFVACEEATTIKLENVDTSQMTNMSGLFDLCSSVENLDLSNFDTSNVESMKEMFNSCGSLKTVNLSSFNTAKVTDMANMFDTCTKLQTLDLSNFDTSKVETMESMFRICNNLNTVNLSGFNTASVKSMKNMFEGCLKLQTLDLSGFNTSKVETMESMFNSCGSLKTLDLSGFTVTACKNTNEMFLYCDELKTIYVASGSDWSETITEGNDMFEGCDYLKGYNGTSYEDVMETGLDYARVDGMNGNPGYFTAILAGTLSVAGESNPPIAGETLTATYTGEAGSNVTFEWYKVLDYETDDIELIEGETSNTYTPSDGGFYRVRVIGTGSYSGMKECDLQVNWY